MKLQHISTFVAVYEERAVTAAAERCHATQSGLSMQIKELEATLGRKLFERSAQGVEPTRAGERFYVRALRLLKELDDTQQEMNTLQETSTATVACGLLPTFSRAVLAPVVSEWTRAHPQVHLRIVEAYSNVLTESVAREEIEFAIVQSGIPDLRVRSRHLARVNEVLVTSAQTSRVHLQPVSLAEAGPLKLILPSLGNQRRTRLDEYVKGVGATIEAVLELDTVLGTLELISQSDWVGIFPATLCDPDIQSGARKLHPLIRPPLVVDYSLITPAVRIASPLADEFTSMLSERARLIGREWSERVGADA